MYNLYGIYNKLNGKLYIGITNNMRRRWHEHLKHAKSPTAKGGFTIHFAMHKYGTQNFIYKSIDTAASLDEANDKEMTWIKELKLNGYQLYNETEGGDGTKGNSHPWTDEQKQAASKRMTGSGNHMYGVQLFGEANGNYGKAMKPHVRTTLLKYRRKLTDEQIREIKTLYAAGNYTQTQLAKRFNIALTQIHRIVHNQSWGTKKKTDILTKHNITEDQVREMRDLYATGNYTQKELGAKYNLSLTQIGRIISRKRWKNI